MIYRKIIRQTNFCIEGDEGMLKEIDCKEIAEYKDAVSLFGEGCVALVENKEKANPITIAWGGLGVLWGKPMCSIFIHKSRYSKGIADDSPYFSVCCFAKEYKPIAIDYFGSASGRNEDKIAKSGFTLLHDEGVPYFKEAELVILCKKMGQTDFDKDKISEDKIKKWYEKDGVHTIYFGEIVKVLKKVDLK